MNEKLKKIVVPEKKGQIFWYLTLSGVLSGLCMAFPTVFGAVIEWVSFIPAASSLSIMSCIKLLLTSSIFVYLLIFYFRIAKT